MAFYSRAEEGDYHTAILISPKNPGANGYRTWRLHATNHINLAMDTQQEWFYEAHRVAGRTSRLLTLVLLG